MKNRPALFTKWRQPQVLPIYYFALLSLGILLVLILSLRSGSESEGAVLLGYSLERLIFGGGLLLLFFVFAITTGVLFRQPDVSKKVWGMVFADQRSAARAFWVSGLIFLLTYITLFLPDYRLGKLAGYVAQLRPTIIWLAAASALTILLIFFEVEKRPLIHQPATKTVFWMWAIVLTIFVLAALIPFTFGLGMQAPEDYWYPTGVPVMGLQVICSLLAGVWTMRFERNRKNGLTNRFDLFICIILWIATAIFWASEPIRPNYFMPDTADNPMLPYSDSANFDIGSQYALIGQGLFNGRYFDRALYIAFLTYLHMLFGQDFESMLFAQAIIFAIFPVIVFLIGRELHSRALGVSAAILVLMRGLNSLLGATWLDTASPKMMLTDFAAAIGVAAIVLFTLKWLKDPSRGTAAIWAGASLGLTIMLRTNVVVLIPVILVCFWFIWRRAGKILLISALLFVIGMLSATTPWDIRNRSNGIPMFYVYYSRIELVLKARYGINGGAFTPPASSPEVASNIAKAPAGNIRQRMIELEDTPRCSNGVCKVANHLFHNYITSVLYLPTSFVLDDLWNTVKLSTPYWSNSWRGEGVGLTAGSFIFFNLAMISLGVAAGWEKNKLMAFVPLILFGAYLASNSLALTSGGRYIVPADWILLVYFMLGLLMVVDWLLQHVGFVPASSRDELKVGPNNFVPQFAGQVNGMIGAFFIVVFLGTLVPLSEVPFTRRYQNESVSETLDRLEQVDALEKSPFSREELEKFLMQPDAVLRVGRLLYPRYYFGGEGEDDRHYPYVKLEYPRLVFQVIGPFFDGRENVIIAGDKPRYDMHALDVVVVGCMSSLNIDRSRNVDGLLVFVLSDDVDVYDRKPSHELKCPLAAPGSAN